MGERQQPGKPITARIINTLARTAERLLGSSQQPPTQQTSFIGGVYEAAERDPKFWAKLTGSANPYDVKEQVGTAGGGWADLSGGRSCTACGHEVNSVTSLTGKVVQVEPALDAKTYNFRYKKVNLGCTGQICVTVKGCNSHTIQGATVHIKDHATGLDIAGSPCTTDATGKCCISITAAASYDITADAHGFTTGSLTVSATCTTNNETITLSPGSGFVCGPVGCACAYPFPSSVTLNDPLGAHTFSYNSTTHNYDGSYTASVTVSYTTTFCVGGPYGGEPQCCASGSITVKCVFVFDPCTGIWSATYSYDGIDNSGAGSQLCFNCTTGANGSIYGSLPITNPDHSNLFDATWTLSGIGATVACSAFSAALNSDGGKAVMPDGTNTIGFTSSRGGAAALNKFCGNALGVLCCDATGELLNGEVTLTS